MKRITAKMLERHFACGRQVEKFRKTFPRGCAVTIANLRKARAARLDISWAAGYLLSGRGWRIYHLAYARSRLAKWGGAELDDAFVAAWRTMHKTKEGHGA